MRKDDPFGTKDNYYINNRYINNNITSSYHFGFLDLHSSNYGAWVALRFEKGNILD
jgi:hypothetical protein